jgi:agmatine/peptidylarginine deiminase
MLTWPHAATDWADDLDEVIGVFAAIASAVSRHQLALNVCDSAAGLARARSCLARAGAVPGNCRFALAPSNDTWARDHGPLTCVRRGHAVLHDFRFNAWGGKFANDLDNAITHRLHDAGVFGNAMRQVHELVLEGGALDTDGRGTLLATRRAVIDDARNPGLGEAALERALGEALGIERFLWLDHGAISGDDTDSHVDTLARFTDARTIVHATAPPGDADHDELAAMAAQLATFRTADGQPYRLLPLPFAGVHRAADGHRLPATYANFLIINDAVLMPAYGVAADAEAAAVLAEALPGRAIVTIDCRRVIEQGGSLHCLTMQFPAALTLTDDPEALS